MSDPLSGLALEARLKELARFTDVEGELTRLTLSPAHKAAAAQVAQWFEAAGMSVRTGSTGTVIGRYAGTDPDAKTLMIGSHIDTVRRAGIYDGNLGVLTGLAVVEALRARGQRMPFNIDVVAFGDEEGVRFPTTLSGSKAAAGTLEASFLDEKDEDGISRREALVAFGANPDTWGDARRDPARTLGYVEVHIEQGPVLEHENLPLGVVTAINGCTRGHVTLVGMAGHAGTLPMALRADALAAASEIILAVEARAKQTPDLVATVGSLQVLGGGAVNVVPGEVRFSLDVRSPSDRDRAHAVDDICDAIRAIAEKRGVKQVITLPYDASATPCDRDFQKRLAAAVEAGQQKVRFLPSGAGHDAMAFRGVLPIAMLFVRCKGGISHNPLEYTSPADMEAGARALMAFVEGMAE